MRRYALLDASVVAGLFVPEAVRSRQARERARVLVEAVRKRAVDDLTLLIPNICIPEVFGVFSKYAYGKYNQQVKTTIDGRRYKTACRLFAEYIHNGAVITQYELNRYHILATDLIAPIDHRFRVRKKGRYMPMTAMDHMIVAMGIVLVRLHGSDPVTLVTNDRRMTDAVERAKRIKPSTAERMGLPDTSDRLGYEWGAQLFPPILRLSNASDQDLVDRLGGWPLPTRAPRGVTVRASALPQDR